MDAVLKPTIVQICYPVADGWLWCNAVHRNGELRENPSGKGYCFPCQSARVSKELEVKGETATNSNSQ
jgi:hypothetical protein